MNVPYNGILSVISLEHTLYNNFGFFSSTGAVGRRGLQGFPGQNIQGRKGNCDKFSFVLHLKILNSCIFSFFVSVFFLFVYSTGFSGSPGLQGVFGFKGDQGEVGLTGDKGLPGIGYNITGKI